MKSLFVFICLSFFISCVSNTNNENKATATKVEISNEKQDSFLLDTIVDNLDNIVGVKKLGIANSGEILASSFFLKNVTEEPLVILNIDGFCGCLKFDYDTKPLMSGEKRKVNFTYDTKQKIGFQFSTVKVFTNKLDYRVRIEAELR